MDLADSPPHRRWLFRIGTALCVLLVLYVLSAGPAMGYLNYRLLADGPGNETILTDSSPVVRLRLVYHPLQSFVQSVALDTPYHNYVMWWTNRVFQLHGTESSYLYIRTY
jgi:hypothetical protein